MLKFIFILNIILLVVLIIIVIYKRLTDKYVSRYTFQLVFGKKGVGKSCSMQKDLIKHHKKGWHCFADSNTNLDFVTLIDPKKIYRYMFPENSFICIDEINLLWDNRDFKTFPKEIQQWFRYQRKYKCKVIAYSQTFDCDKKLRDLCDRLAIQRKILRVWSIRRYYVKTPVIINADSHNEQASIGDDYIKVPWYLHGIDITYLPKYIKSYDTNEVVHDLQKDMIKLDFESVLQNEDNEICEDNKLDNENNSSVDEFIQNL